MSKISENKLLHNNNSITNFSCDSVKVDSTKISIQLSKCKILDTNLIDPIQFTEVNINTGEEINSQFKYGKPTVIQNSDGTYLKFWKEKQFTYIQGKKYSDLYITFLVNSKHLKHNYYNGITTDTLSQIYDFIMSYKVVYFDYQDLYDSRYTDTDICFDFIVDSDTYENIKEQLKVRSIKPHLFHTSKQDNNSGIWTPTRTEPRKNATPSTPYFKLYSKEEDFTYKSVDFAKAYLTPSMYKNKYRLEATISNSTHKKKLGIAKCLKFGDFLKLDLQLLIKSIVKEYYERHTQRIYKSKDLTPMEKVLIDMMNDLVKFGLTNQQLQSYFDRDDISRQSKKVLLEKYYKITQLEDFDKNQLNVNSSTNDFFNFIGL